MARESDPRTRARDRVLLQLKTKGPQPAAQLARALEITPMAVRQHLAALEAEDLVRHSDRRGNVGRPARIWELTPKAASRFPDSHAELTVDLIEVMRDTLGEEGLERVVSARTERHLESYRARLPGSASPIEERVAALTQLRCDEGYMAEWKLEPDGSWLLTENHCPICAAATICQGLCRDELSLFRSALGDDVTVERTEHLLSGARRCAYRVTASPQH
jgi:predicted ArsR family transcriptional regulator